MNSHHVASLTPSGVLVRLCWELSGVREPHALPVWMACSGWCGGGVCMCCGGQVWVSIVPCCPMGASALAASQREVSAGSVGAWAMIQLWKKGFSQVQAWCFAMFASAKPVASPAMEA